MDNELALYIVGMTIEDKAYSFQREQHSYERLKNGGYPNVEALEARYREMMYV